MFIQAFYNSYSTFVYSALGDSTMSFYLPRVTHRDCLHLDDVVHRHFASSLISCLQNFHNSVSSWKPEIEMILKLFIWRRTVRASGQTVGQRLLSCHYSQKDDRVASSDKLMLYAVSNALSAWLKARAEDLKFPGLTIFHVRIFQACSKILQAVNAFIFLFEGRFASLSERFFGLSMKSSFRRTLNTAPSAILLRELLWDGLSEFLTFFWPLMQRTRWMARVRHLTNSESVISVDEGTCVLCSLSPKIQPHGFCAHSFCYFCVANAFAESSEFFICPLCGLELTTMEELKPVSAS